jgi:hypothetical protein
MARDECDGMIVNTALGNMKINKKGGTVHCIMPPIGNGGVKKMKG